jgi:hypothetical protein
MSPFPRPHPRLALAALPLLSVVLAAPASASAASDIATPIQQLPTAPAGFAAGNGLVSWTTGRYDDPAQRPLPIPTRFDLWTATGSGARIAVEGIPSGDWEAGTDAAGAPVLVSGPLLLDVRTGTVRTLRLGVPIARLGAVAIDAGRLYFAVNAARPSRSTHALLRVARLSGTTLGRRTLVRRIPRGERVDGLLADGNRLAVDTSSRTVADGRTGTLRQTRAGTPRGAWRATNRVLIQEGPIPTVRALGFTPDRRALVSAVSDDDHATTRIERLPLRGTAGPSTTRLHGKYSADIGYDRVSGRLLLFERAADGGIGGTVGWSAPRR